MHQYELPITALRERDPEFAEILRRARAGSATAFDELVTRVREQIRRWARRLTPDTDDAEDVAQLVLLRLHVHLREFDGRSRFSTWVYRVTRNVALNHRRLEKRRALLRLRMDGPIADSAEAEVERQVESERIAYLVRFYFEELRGRQREIFELADLQGKSTAEIAELLGIKPVTVRVTLLHARRAIRLRILEEHPELLEDYAP